MGVRMAEHAVVIAGGGPTGLMLAAELALAGVDVAIVERRPSQDLPGSRAGGLHSRTIEIFDQRGIADRFLSEGQVAQVAGYAGTPLDISDFPTRHNYGLGLWQNHIERILAGWVDELEVPIYRDREVTGFAQDDTGVDVALANGESLRAHYLVGCDGGRSVIRKAAGIEFPGWDPTMSALIAQVEMTEEPELGIRRTPSGMHALGKVEYEIKDGEVIYGEGGTVGVMLTESQVGTSEPTLRDLSEGLVAVYGTDYGIHSPTFISRFTDTTRQAAAYRKGRVLLAGDAAHVHSPVGGQGLNTGVQDAVNLGWKLAQVVDGTSPETLLDTYHAERHPVAARVLRHTMAQVALMRPDDRIEAARETVSELLSMDEPRRRFAAMMSGLDIHYDLGEGHPLLGRRMPDLDLVTADGPLRVFTLLHDAGPVLIDLGEPGGFDITPWADRVHSIDAEYAGDWELPALGQSGRSRGRAGQTRWIRRLGRGRHGCRLARRADYLVRIALAALDRQVAGDPVAPRARIELRVVATGPRERQQVGRRGDAGAAVDDELVRVEDLPRDLRQTDRREVDRAGDAARDRVDRLGLAAVALAHPCVDDHEPRLAEPRLELLGLDRVARAYGRNERLGGNVLLPGLQSPDPRADAAVEHGDVLMAEVPEQPPEPRRAAATCPGRTRRRTRRRPIPARPAARAKSSSAGSGCRPPGAAGESAGAESSVSTSRNDAPGM